MPDWLIGLLVVDGVVRGISLIVALAEGRDEWSDREITRVASRLVLFGCLYGVTAAGRALYRGTSGKPGLLAMAELPKPKMPRLLGGGRCEPEEGQLAIAPGEGGELSKVK